MNDSDEIGKIINDNEAALLRYAVRLSGDVEDARDAVQDGFIRFIRYVRSHDGALGGIKTPSAWLYRVVRNCCLDKLRTEKRNPRMSLDDENFAYIAPVGAGPDPAASASAGDDCRVIRGLVERLTPRNREILLLKVEHGKSYREIAEITGITPSNVGFILHTSMKTLRGWFNERNGEVSP